MDSCDPLQEQQLLLTTEPSLRSEFIIFSYVGQVQGSASTLGGHRYRIPGAAVTSNCERVWVLGIDLMPLLYLFVCLFV